jgi:hypothetical protein
MRIRSSMIVGLIGSSILVLSIPLSGCGTPAETPPVETVQTPTAVPTLVVTHALAPTVTQTLTAAPREINTPTVIPSQTAPAPPSGNFLFDDFNYRDQETMTANGWIIREKAGWPGMRQASWSKDNVSFVDDPDQPGNRLVQMTSATDGTASGTRQSQFCHQRKYLTGTYATRVRFSDTPANGPDGDQVVETFYMISPLEAPMDPDFSEMDNEYLPNGGWGNQEHVFFLTTWETAQIEPWKADNDSDALPRSMDGWHTLVVQVMNGRVHYLVDGKAVASHGGKYYPDVPMSINYNLWFIDGGLFKSRELRQ